MDETTTVKQKLSEILAGAASEAKKSGKLLSVVLPEIIIERPQNAANGDYASSLALKLGRATGTNPLDIARIIADFVVPGQEIEKVEVAPPGFINFTLKTDWLNRQVDSILTIKQAYGNSNSGKGSRVQIEFVSVNPTGPLHVGHGRGAILGSTLANVLGSAGYKIVREYYLNDAGNQVDVFKRSLYARYKQHFGFPAELPADGYQGAYMVDLASEIATEEAERFINLPENEAINQLGEIGLQKMIKQIKADLALLRVDFDVWFSERSLYETGLYKKVITMLQDKGYLAAREGAVWFVSTALGDEKDNVVERSDGSPTYFAADIAYHYNKFLERNFDRVINIWGADHQGHVSRMKAVVSALGIAPERLEFIISQLVTLRRGQEVVRISKRSGDIITLREVIDEVGVDACRFFFLARSADAQMDFDLELAKKQSQENPVYYVQYAHARISSILRLARQRGINYGDGDVSLLTCEPELVLIRKMLLLPEIMEVIVQTLQPHHLTYYAQDLATVFHAFYKQCRVVSKDEALTKARLKLVEAAKIVLAKTLNLMGVNAPEKM